MPERRIINLSLHRSGTQSFIRFCEDLGFSTVHWLGTEFDERCASSAATRDTDGIFEIYTPYLVDIDVCADLPVPILARQLIGAFPEAKFLAIKRPVAEWISSVRRHLAGRSLTHLETVMYWDICKARVHDFGDYTDEDLAFGYQNYYRNLQQLIDVSGLELTQFNLKSPELGTQLKAFLNIDDEGVTFSNIDSNRHFYVSEKLGSAPNGVEVTGDKPDAPLVTRSIGTSDSEDSSTLRNTDHSFTKVPTVNYKFAPEDGSNIFAEKFSGLADTEWMEILVRSQVQGSIDGVHFPAFPDDQYQSMIHGNSGEVSIIEAGAFYSFIKNHTFASLPTNQRSRVLDFGSGWGRTIRPFLRDFELANMFGFEPNFLSCVMARTLNPYVNFLAGPYTPNGSLPSDFFNLSFSWSVFSHLAQPSAIMWLQELARAITRGGSLVFTTWGERFLNRLALEADQQSRGEAIHWYSAICIAAAGDINRRVEEYRAGDYVWFTNGNSTLYGEAFLSLSALERILKQYHLPFRITLFDDSSLGQDVFILRRM